MNTPENVIITNIIKQLYYDRVLYGLVLSYKI